MRATNWCRWWGQEIRAGYNAGLVKTGMPLSQATREFRKGLWSFGLLAAVVLLAELGFTLWP